MDIIVGKNAGFCYGVRNAVLGAKEILKDNDYVYCIGAIVHNGGVIKELEKDGLRIIDGINEKCDKLLIRAHGVPKEIYKKARKLNIKLFDYTCPNVLKIHKLAKEYNKKNYYIFLIGIKTHPETIGTISFCGNKSTIIETKEDLEEAILNFKKSLMDKALILVQTTFSQEKFNLYVQKIKNRLKENKIKIEIQNTICNATKIRQKETEEISKYVDCMIIIGGKNSSNTQKLYEIAKNNCIKSYLIESYKQLDINEFKNAKKVGIMAGASTPKESINEIIDFFKNNN